MQERNLIVVPWNIVYLHTHDSGRYWSPFGHALPTPRIHAFARESTLFRQCYSAAPTCSPSRAALLTGMSAHACGMTGLAHRGFQLDDYNRHLVRFLSRSGWKTALCGIQHEASEAARIGYGEILAGIHDDMGKTAQSLEEWDRANTGVACEWLAAQQGQQHPFFLSMGWFNTHRTYPKAGADIDPDTLQVPWPLTDSKETRRDYADYHASVRVVDDCVGRILDTLHETGLMDRTVVLLTTDHGIAFPQMKCTLYDTGIGVGLLLRFPGNPSAGSVTAALVSHLDVFPTLCDLIGLPPPPWLEGHSLVPLLEGRKKKVREAVFAEINYHAAYEPARCVRTERFKLIRRYGDRDLPVVCNVDGSLSKTRLLADGGLRTPQDREALYDLRLDPVERINLAADPAYRTVLASLSSRMDEWMRRTGDPLLPEGVRVPKPAGARINRQDCEDATLPEWEE
jgi:arylsulfatase A-like enzyme